MRGSHVGTYLSSFGIWHHTQRFLKKDVSNSNTVHHLDFEAPTREHASLRPGDILKVIIPSRDRERGYAGLAFSNLIVGSDFTKSNEWTSWRKEQSFCVTRFV